jgi:hypothetical protein
VAPRTEAQQIAYNAKRRQETAERKVPHGKAKSKAAKKAAAPKARKTVVRAKPKRKGPTNMLLAAMAKAKVKEVAKPVEERVNSKMQALAKAVKSMGPPKVDTPSIKHTGMHPLQPAMAMQHTLPRSYRRKEKSGVGKLRRGTYQCTVSFTEPQMKALVAKAGFRCVSLAEMIRICVCKDLGL